MELTRDDVEFKAASSRGAGGMTSDGPELAAAAPRARRPRDAARVVVSEWTKLHLAALDALVAAASRRARHRRARALAAVTASHWGHMAPAQRADRQPLDIALAGVNIAELAIAVLGVLAITGEYSTGMIRATLTAVPKRSARAVGEARPSSRSSPSG